MFPVAWFGFLDFLAAQYGNLASVLGLFLTLYTLRKVVQVREATRQAVRAALGQLAAQLFRHDVTEGLRLVREMSEACRAKRWARAIDKGEDARDCLRGLRHSSHLQETEAAGLDAAFKDLRLFEGYLEVRARSRAKQKPLPGTRLRKLADIIDLLVGIAGRLRITLLEG